jgi:hypothetical protein
MKKFIKGITIVSIFVVSIVACKGLAKAVHNSRKSQLA